MLLPRKICSPDLPSLPVLAPTPPGPRHLYSLKPVYRVLKQLSSTELFRLSIRGYRGRGITAAVLARHSSSGRGHTVTVTHVKGEVYRLQTYDRAVIKANASKGAQVNQTLITTSKALNP